MTKQTLEEALLSRRADPRALRGALTFAGGKPQITFGVVGTIPRFSLVVSGDKITIQNDPRQEAEADEEDAEITAKKAEADELGVKYNANIGLPALTKKVTEALEAKTAPEPS